MRKKFAATVSATALTTLAFAALGGVASATPAAPAAGGFTANVQTSDVHVAVGGGLLGGAADTEVNVAPASVKIDSSAADKMKSVATAANAEIKLGKSDLQIPQKVEQSALPDNAKPASNSLDLRNTAISGLVSANLLQGQAQARWNDAPCTVNPLAASSTNAADLTVGQGRLTDVINALPGLGGLGALTQPVDDALSSLKNGSLVKAEGTIASSSSANLVKVAGQSGKAVRTESTVQASDITVLEGTEKALRVKVIRAPKMVGIATGSAATSTVTYEAPILEVTLGGKVLAKLDAENPTANVPLAEILPANVLDSLKNVDLGLVQLKIADFDKEITGNKVSGHAALVDVEVLPSEHGKALASVSVGEQHVEATAPAGGVACEGGDNNGGDNGGNNQGGDKKPALANTGSSDQTPFIIGGGVVLFVGLGLMAVTPARRRVVSLVKKNN